MLFKRLLIQDWRQFREIEIEFDSRLTVITGANGAGKSTLLRVLSQHFGWTQPLLATPSFNKDGKISYLSGLFSRFRRASPSPPEGGQIGSIDYSNGLQASIFVPSSHAITYNVAINPQASIPGLHVSSHRPVSNYQQVANIPTNALDAQLAYQAYHYETLQKYNNGHTGYSPIYRMKEALISMATFGPGNGYVQRNEEIARLFEDFKHILSEVLPASIGFTNISVRLPDVVFETKSGDFVIDAASGGLMSIIDLAWQIFLFSRDKQEFVVTMDEPENHLHPSMQRALLSRLVSAFSRAQFIVATHSPFVVSSVKESKVYALAYATETSEGLPSERTIHSVRVDLDTKAGTANEILRDVLGVPVTLPEWAEADLTGIVNRFALATFDGEAIKNLRAQLSQAGLSEYYPEAITRIAAR